MTLPIQPHERARFDQDAAAIDHMISAAREHRVEYCVATDLPCVGDALFQHLQALSHHDLFVVAAMCIARLADLPAPPTTIEGISE